MYWCVGGRSPAACVAVVALHAVHVEFCREVCRVRGVALAFTPCPQRAPEKERDERKHHSKLCCSLLGNK